MPRRQTGTQITLLGTAWTASGRLRLPRIATVIQRAFTVYAEPDQGVYGVDM